MTTRTYTVPGMSCDHCRHAIETEVTKLAGVDTVGVDLEQKLVRVEGDASEADVRTAIDEAGYDVTSVS
ncbi:MAG: heavy-metal-associated domain-containing protein [Acidimicrobiales bacterium]|nr:heavy-metal-associated domain-containing protein [Acidimicrobiales bacterium]